MIPFPLLLAAALALPLMSFVVLPWWRRRRWAKQASEPLTQQQLQWLSQLFPLYRGLQPFEQQALHKHIQWFLANKRFVGCEGMTVQPWMPLLVAANACLLVLYRRYPLYPKVQDILLYPSAYVSQQQYLDGAGVVHHHPVTRLGEAWQGGTVVLSIADVVKDNQNATDGQQLVLHEFAHQLDHESGAANGAPPLRNAQIQARWQQLFSQAFAQLKQGYQHHGVSPINPYGFTNEAEFFAVVTETFFERPQWLSRDWPELYGLLREFFQVDPLRWHLHGF